MTGGKRDRCRFCGRVYLPGSPVEQRPDGAMLLCHLSEPHTHQVGPYRERMHTKDIRAVAAEAHEVVEH
jgi:hypothetical protein